MAARESRAAVVKMVAANMISDAELETPRELLSDPAFAVNSYRTISTWGKPRWSSVSPDGIRAPRGSVGSGPDRRFELRGDGVDEYAASSMMSLADVAVVARRAHAGQVDKAGRAYAEHLAAVAAGVHQRGGSDEQIAAAWLHDGIEDQVLSEQWLATAPLSERTKDIVLAVTKRADETPEDYAREILATDGARLVKQADLAHNADPERVALLDEATRQRLSHKYARMRALLGLDA